MREGIEREERSTRMDWIWNLTILMSKMLKIACFPPATQSLLSWRVKSLIEENH